MTNPNIRFPERVYAVLSDRVGATPKHAHWEPEDYPRAELNAHPERGERHPTRPGLHRGTQGHACLPTCLERRPLGYRAALA